MLLKNYYRLSILLCFLLFFLVSCDLIPSVAVNGTPIITTGNNTPDDASTPQLNVWSKVATGVELRYEDWKSPTGDDDTVTIVRFDVCHVRLSVGYQPAHPLYLSDWMRKEKATAIINGGYFDQQNRATGLVISNGQVFGTSYSGFGGMLLVDGQGRLRLRYLVQQPYDPSEQLKQATQSAPMLVLPGGKLSKFSTTAYCDYCSPGVDMIVIPRRISSWMTRTASSSGTTRLSSWERSLSSMQSCLSERLLTTTRSGRPARSASLNLTPADSARSSKSTSTPAASKST